MLNGEIDRRAFLGVAAGAGVCAATGAFAREDGDPTIIGHRDHRFRAVRGWGVQDPAKIPVRDCHEMVMTRDGRLFLFGNHTKNNMIIYNKDGKVTGTWGDAYPGGHGLTLAEENGDEFLYLTDPDLHKVFKTTLDGEVVLELDAPLETDEYDDAARYKPTEVAVAPNGDFYVADGYGSQYLLHYAHSGELKGVYAGPGGEADKFNNMHGVCIDSRDPANPVLLLTARAQNRFKRFTLDGKHISTVELPGAWICRPVIRADLLMFAVIISDLPQWQSNRSGFVAILDRNDRVVSCPGGHEPVYKDGVLQPLKQATKTFMHPHDVCMDRDGNLFVPQWNSDRTYPIKLECIG